ncbi:MAG TPA: amidohydrolase family protein [Povalibacter sp.]|uniref:amidohydrolase family protein n=1 Tax=Povalibacter sp. TaxID=1962978 RepID=UPI002BC2906F|nr:amidohydrolase family protein [Povalibacter sp.]HMN45869.1 amidohydrolase family protein [Povalibacter sp.]
MSTILRNAALGAVMTAMLGACATQPEKSAVPVAPAAAPATADADAPWKAQAALPHRSLASFAKPSNEQACYDRKKEPYTPVVDAHFHPRPFGGQAIPPQELFEYFDKLGVRFVNYFGIGQSLDMRSACTYYLDCPGTSALPSIKNDFVNGQETKAYPHPNLNITLSMTFMDLAHPEDIVKTIELYDREFPGMFKWSGELNVFKQALVPNKHEPATIASIDAWAPFMKVLRERGIPVTLHMDLGSDAEPTRNVYLMKHILEKYPDNKIVWAHAGLSKELQHMDPALHVRLMAEAFALSKNLMLDISWDVLYNAYHEFGPQFIAFFNVYPDRILPGSDFVAARNKGFEQYAKEFEVTSRALKFLSDDAFRKIALGENYFRLMNLDYQAPEICK